MISRPVTIKIKAVRYTVQYNPEGIFVKLGMMIGRIPG